MPDEVRALIERARNNDATIGSLIGDLCDALEAALERVGALEQERHSGPLSVWNDSKHAELARLTTRYQELKEKARRFRDHHIGHQGWDDHCEREFTALIEENPSE